ncbi:hypothetical protein AX14_009578 [Amanita brunnescens Koide BX004]|nr:hypothetical protein AX14_009578 [Amanita brunnescens Koide BX004]
MASYAHELPYTIPLTYLSLFGIGAVVMCGAGNTIDDMWDKDFDKVVERTKNRPLTRGDLNLRQATVFLGAELTVGLCILLQLNQYSVLYPFTKQIMYWPSAVLG